ncbi:hypothetical protein GCM10009718_27940 [Isoptericola halotolerans]|uniref:Flp pilus assembly CpaF family ATPase n=1 Tax=Isoptericola halotolerans TaxID=300560 RepID=A0ABX2A3U4_9MICO|nr:ATPase, T2SS/T4P/T4SS family [Isoptericola halotolerans]NOV97356.1 Flp pilus assembly CpaF family ATPase [Isoptericola halotolerans]
MSNLPHDPSDLPIFGGSGTGNDELSPLAHALAGTLTERGGARGAQAAGDPAAPASTPVAVQHADAPPSYPPAFRPAGPARPAPAQQAESVQSPVHAPAQAPAPAPTRAPAQAGSIDWKQVAALRSQASEQLTAALGEERGADLETERELGRAIITELLQSTVADRIHDGEPTWNLVEQQQMAEAVFNALFGLGRLQPYVDDDSVENIIITGAANVWLEKTDGMLVRAEPVADSDAELLDFLSFVASRSEVNARSFSSASPRLHMRLDGGARLAAAAWVTARPSVVIRRHRLRKVTLGDLIGRNMLTPVAASLLSAAVRAGKSIVVAGPQGAGKTTMVRALCAEFEPHEKIGTFETEFELHLHELPDVHPIVHAWEARPGSGEIGADGKQAGEFTLDEALYDSFRFNLSRQIVGEVRGREVWAMIKAMESGTGSISTTHSSDGEAAIRKLVTCAMEAGPHVTRDLATSKLAETVDIIVQVHLETTSLGDDQWRRDRWVSEIVHVTPGEVAKGYATTRVFAPNPAGGPAVPGTLPDELRSLTRYGFDLDGYLAASVGEQVA